MSRKEINSLPVLEKLKNGKITQKIAAMQLSLSVRQIRNKLRRYLKYGAKGVVHKSRGRPSPKRTPSEVRNQIIELIQENYHDFGPTFASEQLLKRHGIQINKETLRKIMIEVGIWKGKKRKQKHRQWRPPKEHFGDMHQLDGSYHQWIEDRSGGPWWTLISFIDDATKKMVWAEFTSGETTFNVFRVTKKSFELNGRPLSIYADRGRVFKVNTNNPDNDKVTQYQRVLKELDVKMIHALSPQAKGRVERSYRTLQDRLVKEMRLEGINSIEEANRFFQEKFLPDYNARYSIAPKSDINVHREVENINLNDAFCTHAYRVVRNDFTIKYFNRFFQLTAEQKAVVRPRGQIVVRRHIDDQITLSIRGIQLQYKEIAKPQKTTNLEREKNVNRIHPKPKADHPWRKTTKIFLL